MSGLMSTHIIYIKHNDWEGNCYFKNNKIYRCDQDDECGNYDIFNNILTIYWEKWEHNTFLSFIDNSYYYSKELYYEKYNEYTFIDNNNIFKIFLDKNSTEFLYFLKNKITGNYNIEDDIIKLIHNDIIKKYKNYNSNYYILEDDFNRFFELKIDDIIEEKYIFNKISKKFYSINNIDNHGIYKIINNSISMTWNNGVNKTFFTNKYLSKSNKNIILIKPKRIIINNKLIFSNISLCKNKIILTSIHYKENSIDFNEIDLRLEDYKIVDKIIYDNDDYESCATIILSLESIYDTVNLKIKYKNIFTKITLNQLNIEKHYISAMTLFKDDIDLLKRYLKYYLNMGVKLFFLYYNKKVDHNILNKIINLNENNAKIYLIEWDYIYMLKYGLLKHHFSQSMAINDSLNILKNYGVYTLYNDLDEYIILDKKFNDLIEEYSDVDIFIFKNRFCKMGEELISYEDFDNKFDLNNIIKGNYWDSMREKNLIKLDKINVMGVHKYFPNFNSNLANEKVIGEFYHIINFKEKHREILMTQYIL
jgi:hypothetical protein